jgi:hypothetical protein
MPLIKSGSDKARSKNIAEMVRSYKKTGKLGNSRPKNIREAISQASAAAYSMQRKKKR